MPGNLSHSKSSKSLLRHPLFFHPGIRPGSIFIGTERSRSELSALFTRSERTRLLLAETETAEYGEANAAVGIVTECDADARIFIFSVPQESSTADCSCASFLERGARQITISGISVVFVV